MTAADDTLRDEVRGQKSRARARKPSLSTGTVLAGRYQLEEFIDGGATGEVYRALDEKLASTVAIKIVRLKTSSPRELTGRVLAEARTVSRLKHPNIVTIHDVNEIDDISYLVLELCERGDLGRIIEANGSSRADRIRWLIEVATALAHAHCHGVIHRDVKPGNILLTRGGIAKVADFGIAKAIWSDSESFRTSRLKGTPSYIAPEQWSGATCDARVDQYALGVVGWELWTGEKHRHRNPAAMRGRLVDAGAPPNVADAIVRATAIDKDERFATMDELLVALRTAAPDSRPVEIPARRKPTRRTLGALGSLALVGVVSPIAAMKLRPTHESTLEMPRCAPNAQPALEAGLQRWRDDSQREAMVRFDEAATADPKCTQAHLYYILSTTHTYPRRREHYESAREHLGSLSERERDLFAVIEPTIWEGTHYDEVLRRASALLAKRPKDEDARRLYERALYRLERYEELAKAVEDIAKEASYPIAWNEQLGALAEIHLRHPDRALKRFDRCLQVSPDSTDCLFWKGMFEGSRDQCTAAEATFRHFTSVVPDNAEAQLYFGQILLQSNIEAARSAFEQRWTLLTPSQTGAEPVAVARTADEFRIAVAEGDLVGALRLARSWNQAVVTAKSNAGRYRLEPLMNLIQVLRELGQDNEARTLALQGLAEQEAWSADEHERVDAQIELARLAYLTHGIDAPRFREIRAKWLESARSKYSPIQVWLSGYAGLPEVGAEMRPPVAEGDMISEWYAEYPETSARAAEEFSALGRHADAIRNAEAGRHQCFATIPIFGKFHIRAALAQAYDRAGDVAAACREYESLRSFVWRTPQSISARLAEARIADLKCGSEASNNNHEEH